MESVFNVYSIITKCCKHSDSDTQLLFVLWDKVRTKASVQCTVFCALNDLRYDKRFESDTINATIPFIQTQQDENVILAIMRLVWTDKKIWIDIDDGM